MALVRFPSAFSKCCHPAFTAALVPLIISHSAEVSSESPPSDEPPQKASLNAATPDLDSFSKLWRRSMFTTHDNTAPQPTAEHQAPEWASDFELSGWTRVDGLLTVYLTRLISGNTLTLHESEPETPDTPQLVAFTGEDTILDGKVQIRINGATAWIALNPSARTHLPNQVSIHEPAAANTRSVQEGTIEPPTTVDSRAALMNGPVVLDASATYETILPPPDKPALNVVQRLRERREKLIRDFPRNTRP